MNRAKLAAVAQIAATIPCYAMAFYKTCALGRSVEAGILTAEDGSAQGIFYPNFCSPLYASEQLGISEDDALEFFMGTAASSHGSECARLIRALLAETAMG